MAVSSSPIGSAPSVRTCGSSSPQVGAKNPALEGLIRRIEAVIGLTLQANSSPENILWALDRASNQGSPEHRTFLNKQIIVNDPIFPVPCTLDSLDKLDKASGGQGFRSVWDKIPRDKPAEQEFHYGVMTKDVIPHSRNKSYDEQISLLPVGYEVPGVFDAVRAFLWENRRTDRRCLANDPWTYTCCKERVDGWRLIVGGRPPAELFVCRNHFAGHVNIGITCWRMF